MTEHYDRVVRIGAVADDVILPVSIDQTAPGTTNLVAADIVKIAGTSPTVPGKLDIATLPATPTGDNYIGQAGNTPFLVTDGFARPADTTAYAAKDAVSAATLAVTGTGAGVGGVVRLTMASTATLATNDAVTVASVGGTTEANGDFLVTVIDATHIDLTYTSAGAAGPAYAHGWTSGGTVQRCGRLANIARKNGGGVLIQLSRLETDLKTETSAYRIWIYSTPPTVIADNSPFTLLWANRTKNRRAVEIPALSTEDPTNSTSAAAKNISDWVKFTCAADRKDLYYQIEVLNAPTPGNAQSFYLEFAGMQD